MADCEVNICILTLDERASAVGRKKRSRKQENDARRPSVSDRRAVDDDKGEATTGREEGMASTSGHSLSGVSGVICRWYFRCVLAKTLERCWKSQKPTVRHRITRRQFHHVVSHALHIHLPFSKTTTRAANGQMVRGGAVVQRFGPMDRDRTTADGAGCSTAAAASAAALVAAGRSRPIHVHHLQGRRFIPPPLHALLRQTIASDRTPHARFGP